MFLFSVNTLHPVAELGGNHEDVSVTDQTHAEGTPLSFFPTVAVTESSMEAFTVKPETHTLVPFIPNNLPDVMSAVTFETPLTEEEVQGYPEGTALIPSDILSLGTVEETTTDVAEDVETEVQEIPVRDPADDRGDTPAELLPDGKFTQGFYLKQDMEDRSELSILRESVQGSIHYLNIERWR